MELDWSISQPSDPLAVNSVPTDLTIAAGAVRVGRDSRGCPHLLVPLAAEEVVVVDRRSAGVLFVEQPLTIDGKDAPFGDLVCTDPLLADVFELLAADVCERIRHAPTEALAAVAAALDQWRHLLLGASGARDESTIIGLRGELEVLRRVALVDAHSALQAWRGFASTIQDFQRDGVLVEVKTTRAHGGSEITVHGLEQLEPPNGQTLYLWLVVLREDDTAESVPELVDDLVSVGVDQAQLYESLERLRYDPAQPEAWPGRYRVERSQVWHVDKGFPGIRKSDLPPTRHRGLKDVQYTLELDAAGAPLEIGEVAAVVRSLAGGAGGA